MTITGDIAYSRYGFHRVGNDYEIRKNDVSLSNVLLIPGVKPVDPLDLFRNGQPGGWPDPYDLTRMWVDDAGTTPATIASLGTGIGRVVTKGNAITLTQANAADRPVWGRHPVSGIRNLIANSEFNGASPNPTSWANGFQDGTQAIVASTAGFSNAIQFTTTANFQRQFITQTITVLANTTYSVRFTIESVSGTTDVACYAANLPSGASTQIILSPSSPGVYTFTFTIGATAGTAQIRLGIGTSGTGATAASLRVSGFSVEAGPTATPYQRVTNRFDITETGVPSLYYFSFNGVNQSWASNATVNFSTTNKVTVWAGLRKIASIGGIIVEHTANSSTTSGSFRFFDGTTGGAIGDFVTWHSRGTATSSIQAALAVNTAASVVGIGDISGDVAKLILNGTSVSSIADQGAGNYSNDTLFIGRRNNATLPYNGLIYNLIIAGDNYDSRTVQRFSDWLLKPRRLITA